MGLTAQDLVKREGILTAGPEDSLATALSHMNSSHDAVFVTAKNRLLGVISPYHTLYRKHFPASAKLKHCLFSPPKLKPQTSFAAIARLMLDSKIYFLPVIGASGKWLGVVSFRRLLRRLPDLNLRLKPKPLITANPTISSAQARALMKKEGVSRLVIVNQNSRLTGILTRYDLSEAMGQPTKPIASLIKRNVITIGLKETVNQAINLMLDKKIGSLVIVGTEFKPIGLLTVRDVLEAVALPRTPRVLPPVQTRLKKVRYGWEVFVRRGRIAASAFGKFKKATLNAALKKLKSRIFK